jgi:hypothetical protein
LNRSSYWGNRLTEQKVAGMKKADKFGIYNGSLFVTRGIAAVGTLFAPVTASPARTDD